MSNVLRDVVFGGLLALVGIALLLYGSQTVGAYWAIRNDPAVTTGVVYDFEVDQAYGWRPFVRFTDEQGRERRFRAWSYYLRQYFGPEKGETVPVRYSRSRPELATIDTVWGTFGTTVYFGLVGLFALVGGLWIMVRWMRGESVHAEIARERKGEEQR